MPESDFFEDSSADDFSPFPSSPPKEHEWNPYFHNIQTQIQQFRQLYRQTPSHTGKLTHIARELGWLVEVAEGSWEEPDVDHEELFSYHGAPSFITGCALTDEIQDIVRTQMLPLSLRQEKPKTVSLLFQISEACSHLRQHLLECAASEELAESSQCQYITKLGLHKCNDVLGILNHLQSHFSTNTCLQPIQDLKYILHDLRTAFLYTRFSAKCWEFENQDMDPDTLED